jgi:flagellar hook protein FlgE
MSIIGAFVAGTTGLNAQSQKLDATSDNISNANTVGYKPTEVLFKTLVIPTGAPTSLGATGPVPFNFAPGGVIPTPESRMDLQGLLTSTQSSTDLAISGRGFFAVTPADQVTGSGTSSTISQGAEIAVTRAGSFTMNKDGQLVNSAGFVLLGTPVGGTLPTSLSGLVPVALNPGPNVTIGGTATTQVTLSGNLPATATAGTTEQQTVGVFDSAGNAYSLGLTFTSAGANSWTVAATSLTPTNTSSGVTATVTSNPAALSFNSSGQLAASANGLSLGTFNLSNGATLTPTFNFGTAGVTGGFTQFGSAFASGGANIDGGGPASRTAITVTPDGTVDEVYSNGTIIPRFQVPVVTFPNAQGLEPLTGNAYLETQGSGKPAILAPNTGGAGQIMPSELEQSSVDLAGEFVNMIISQSVFQANTKTITTADQMYQTVIQLR